MGWFNKKEKREERGDYPPELPELPKLPDFPTIEEGPARPIHQLPSFPNSSIGKEFSQKTIKNAITGEKEGDEVFDADEFDLPELPTQRMHRPLTREIDDFPTHPSKKRYEKAEPVFIRIDKFEEGLKVFEKTKEKIMEIEKTLRDINKIKEAEEKELEDWEEEIREIKNHIEQVDQDIFSKIE